MRSTHLGSKPTRVNKPNTPHTQQKEQVHVRTEAHRGARRGAHRSVVMRPPPQLPVLLLLLAAGLWGSGARHQRTPLGFPGHPGKHRGLEGHPKDPRLKEVFIIHLTGPLYFNPKCRKQFHRLYNYTRDCTVPAYYKRCARLLIQLAKSPRCAER